MNRDSVLITGGAGFIGSFVADELLQAGYEVRVLDSLEPQVHSLDAGRPEYLDDRVELVVGDVRDSGLVRECLDGIDMVVHLAAAVGVGQSMYQVDRYTAVNNLGTAALLEELTEATVERLVVASSMSLYGEGRYEDSTGTVFDRIERTADQLERKQWEPVSPTGDPLHPVPTPEDKWPTLTSVYALSKYDQEQMCLIVGRAYDIPTVALRLFNVYGARQALSNPYTGVMAIFASRLLNDRSPLIYEDGQQRRDFVHVRDVASSFRLALEADDVRGVVLNIGSGESRTIEEIARAMAAALDKEDIEPEITERGRAGDVRHCFADVSRARELLGYEPDVSFSEGLEELTRWVADQAADDAIETADSELDRRGLIY